MGSYLRQWLVNLAPSLAAGYILMFYSEVYFLPLNSATEGGVNLAAPLSIVEMWLYYSLVAYVLLALLHWSRAAGVAAVFLAGAAFGWLLEGAVVSTTYESFPWFIAWTGLAWHALLDVLFGLWWLPRLISAHPRRAALVVTIAGIGWGIWVLWWGSETGSPLPPALTALIMCGSALVLAAAYGVFHASVARFRPQGAVLWLIGGWLALSWALGALMAYPLLAWVLIPLLALCLLGLRGARMQGGASYLSTLAPLKLRDYGLPLVLGPLGAASYALHALLGISWPTHIFVFVIGSSAGWLLFAYGLLRHWLIPAVRGVRRSAVSGA